MSSPQPDPQKRTSRIRLLYRRKVGPLLGPWIAGIIVAGGIYFFERSMPAFHQVVKPVYWVIATILVLVTLRAVRARSGSRRHAERRHGDRRHGD